MNIGNQSTHTYTQHDGRNTHLVTLIISLAHVSKQTLTSQTITTSVSASASNWPGHSISKHNDYLALILSYQQRVMQQLPLGTILSPDELTLKAVSLMSAEEEERLAFSQMRTSTDHWWRTYWHHLSKSSSMWRGEAAASFFVLASHCLASKKCCFIRALVGL